MTGSNVEKNFIYGIPLVDLPTYKQAPPVDGKPTVPHEGVNLPLLNEIMEYIKAHPMQWRQEAWYKILDLDTGEVRYDTEEQIVEEINSCGAAMCFAGHVALREGFPSPPKDNHHEWNRWIPTEEGWYSESRDERGFYEDVSSFAETRLGINWSVGDALFDGENTLEQLQDMVEALNLNPEINGYELVEIRDRDREDYPNVRQFMIQEAYLVPQAA